MTASGTVTLQDFVEQAPLGIAMFDTDMRYLAASRRWLSDYGVAGPVTGKSHYEVFPEIPERWKEIHRRALGGEVLREEIDCFERAHGQVQWVRWEVQPWRRNDGEIGGIIIFAEDVTDRKRTKQTQRESEERLEFALEISRTGAWELNLLDHTSRRSLQHDRIFGYERMLPEWTYEMFLEHVVPEDRDFVDTTFHNAMANGSDWNFECRIRRADCEIRWIWAAGRHRQAHDEHACVMAGFVQDITEQKEAQRQLLEAQQRLQAIMQAAPVGISYSDDPSCERITGNPALLSQFEMAPDANASASASDPAAAGRQLRFFRDGQEIAACELPLQRAVAEAHEIPPMQLEVLLPSGRRWFAAASAAPIMGEQGKIIGGVAVTVDITEHLRIEQALRENDRRKDEFLAMLAHELRNPLAPIRNGLYVLQRLDNDDPASKDRARSMLTIVERQVAHLVRLVDDLLETARITSGKVELKKQHVDLRAVIQQALQMSEPAIQAGGQEISVSLTNQPVIVDGDPVRLTQVFANLLNNAAKYTPREGRIEISMKRGGDQASVSVRDDGMGISPEMLSQIFDLFAQSHRAKGREQGGIGVGLALVRSLVEMHGGQVEARSEGVGCGSEFVVRIPFVLTSLGAEKTEDETAVSSIPAFCRVLVVDDNRDVADALVMLLQALGCDVRTAYSGVAGLAAVAEFKPQLAFVDIGMPSMDGYETAR